MLFLIGILKKKSIVFFSNSRWPRNSFKILNGNWIYPRGSRSRLVHGPAQTTTALDVRTLLESKNIFVLSPKGTIFSTKQLSMIVPPEFWNKDQTVLRALSVVDWHYNPGLFNPAFSTPDFQPWALQPQSWIWGWKVQTPDPRSRKVRTLDPMGWKVQVWRVHGWKIWRWEVLGRILGLKCPATLSAIKTPAAGS